MKLLACAVFALCCSAAAAGGELTREALDGPKDAVVRVSLDWLVNTLPDGDDEVQARYVGKTLLFEGWVEEMGRDGNGWYIAVRRYSARPTGTRCYFSDGGDQLDFVYKGMTVELLGVCLGYDAELDALVFRDTRVIIQDFRSDIE